MPESDTHKHLKNLALHYLKRLCTDIVANEVKLFVSRQKLLADAAGLNFKRKEIRFIEVKASKADFVRDDKLFDDRFSYAKLGHYAYIMCPKGVLTPEDMPTGYGLLVVDEFDNIEMLKKPTKNPKSKVTFDTALKRTARALTNQFLFKDENKANKDETDGKFSRNSKIKLISVRCPSCKKSVKELIHIDKTKTVVCKCKTEIDLEKAKIREITGFNNAFIKKVNKLIEGSESDG